MKKREITNNRRYLDSKKHKQTNAKRQINNKNNSAITKKRERELKEGMGERRDQREKKWKRRWTKA